MDPDGTAFDGECYDRSMSLDAYFPNMCRICRCFGEKANKLRRCGACNMILYCSVEHQKQDWPNHKEFCKVMTDLNKKGQGIENLLTKFKHHVGHESISKNNEKEMNFLNPLIVELIDTATVSMKRELKIHEEEMIFYPRFCAVCFEHKPELLTNCRRCPQHSFCKKHLNDSSRYEDECLKFIFIIALTKQTEILNEVGWIINLSKFPYPEKTVNFPTSITNFLETYFAHGLGIGNAFDEDKKLVFNSYLAGQFSRPLTLLFTMEKLALNLPSVLIHVIGATSEECSDDWELVLHFLPQLKELKIVFVGPNLSNYAAYDLNVCSKCKKIGKKITFECKSMMYEKYFIEKSFKTPDLIAGFNPAFHAYSSWNKCLKVLGKIHSPLMITAYSRFEGLEDKEVIESKFASAKVIYFDYNPFHGFTHIRAILNFVTTKNQFILLYKHLDAGKRRK